MYYNLTIGQISTLIAAAVFIARFVLPNALALLLVRIVGQSQNATTWGFVQRFLARSDWPVLLMSDSMAIGSVDFKVRLLNWLQLVTTLILTIAAILTPAGLYDVYTTDRSLVPTSFSLVNDDGIFGIGTQMQNDRPWRTCGGYADADEEHLININCPGTTQNYTLTRNATTGRYTQRWDGNTQIVGVNTSRAVLFHSGIRDLGRTVSSFFDIKPRRISRSQQTISGGPVVGGYLSVNAFQFRQSVIDTPRYQIIEGLIVDAQDGAIGFRNHTIPANVPLGSTWTEDILFLELEVETVDLNVSFVYNVDYVTSSSNTQPYSLVDDGGFVNFDKNYNPINPTVRQDNLYLRERASNMAWSLLSQTMKQPMMNLSTNGLPDPTRSRIGQKYAQLDDGKFGATFTQTDTLGIDSISDILYRNPGALNGSIANSSSPSRQANSLLLPCTAWNQTYKVNATAIPIMCNVLLGAPSLVNGDPFDLAIEGMTLKRKVYAFAAATKLSIKTVTFSYNATGQTPLDGLKILSIIPKVYASQNDLPRWAMETPDIYNGNIQTLWGLISKEYETTPDITVIRAPHLYPVYQSSGFNDLDVTLRTDAYITGSTALDDLQSALTSVSLRRVSSYLTASVNSGKGSPLLFRRWQNLSKNASSAAHIVKLIHTNFAANYLQGTRGWLSEDVVPPPFRNLTGNLQSTDVLTHVQKRVIRYHWPYGVPAFLSLILLAVIAFVAFAAAITGSIRQVGRLLAVLSAGRLLTDLMSRDEGESIYQERYKPWSKTAGQKRMQLNAWGWKEKSWQMDERRSDRNLKFPNHMSESVDPSRPQAGEARPFLHQ